MLVTELSIFIINFILLCIRYNVFSLSPYRSAVTVLTEANTIEVILDFIIFTIKGSLLFGPCHNYYDILDVSIKKVYPYNTFNIIDFDILKN